MSEQIATNYIVLEVREQKHSDIAPIVLICKTENWPHHRRRIEIRNHRVDEEIYNTAKLIVSGDFITIKETLLGNVKRDNGLCVRQLDDLIVHFSKEAV